MGVRLGVFLISMCVYLCVYLCNVCVCVSNKYVIVYYIPYLSGERKMARNLFS